MTPAVLLRGVCLVALLAAPRAQEDDLFNGTCNANLVVLRGNIVAQQAGCVDGTTTYFNSYGQGTASMVAPAGVFLYGDAGPEMQLLVVDANGSSLRAINTTNLGTDKPMTTRTVAGKCRSAGVVDGPNSAARFRSPTGIASCTRGDPGATPDVVFVVDTAFHGVRAVSLYNTRATSTLVGGDERGFVDGVGTGARFSGPTGVACSAAGVLFVADSDNHVIRTVDTALGRVATLAGSGSSVQPGVDGVGSAAGFSGPSGVALSTAGDVLYVTDTLNHAIRAVDVASGRVSTLAGGAGAGYANGARAGARFNRPTAIAVDGWTGVLVIADTGNDVMRWLYASSGRAGLAAGRVGLPAYVEGVGTVAQFSAPRGVTWFGQGQQGPIFVVSDTGNHALRFLYCAGGLVSTLSPSPSPRPPSGSSTATATVTPSMLPPLPPDAGNGAPRAPAPTDLSTGATVGVALGCTFVLAGIAAVVVLLGRPSGSKRIGGAWQVVTVHSQDVLGGWAGSHVNPLHTRGVARPSPRPAPHEEEAPEDALPVSHAPAVYYSDAGASAVAAALLEEEASDPVAALPEFCAGETMALPRGESP